MKSEIMAVTIPQSVEFSVSTDFISNLPQILSNIEEVRQWAVSQTETDRSLKLVSDDDFDTAKKRCAEINKVVQRIDDKRKEVKKAYTEPYDIFEKKLKEVTAVLTDAKNNLWGQIKEAEEAVKREKDAKYRDYYEKVTADLTYKPSYERIFKTEWLNKGTTEKSVYADIDGQLEGYNKEVATIKAVGGEYTSAMLSYYLLGNSFQDTIAYSQQLRATKEAEAQRQTETEQTAPEQTATNTAETEKITVDFRVTCTREQLQGLKQYLNTNGIKYGRAGGKE